MVAVLGTTGLTSAVRDSLLSLLEWYPTNVPICVLAWRVVEKRYRRRRGAGGEQA